MKLSIVMATYNGSKYIDEQLESIYNQTRKVDEVIIFDDGSSDDTCDKIISFINCKGIESSWKLICNKNKKGVVLNFLDGADYASGDIIFYSDQDDIWDYRKVEIMEKGFIKYPDMQACYCLRYFINSDGTEIPMRFDFMNNVRVKCKEFQKVSVQEAVKYNKSPGLCLAIRKSLINETREMILNNNLTHDLPIGTVAAIHNGYYVYNQKLVYYRQHGANVSAARYTVKSRLTRIDSQIRGRQMRVKQMESIMLLYKNILNKRDKKNLSKAIVSTKKSIINLQNKNIWKLFLSIFDLNPMMNRWIAINNFIIVLRSNV